MTLTVKLSLCIFIHHSTQNAIPEYVKIYIDELSCYFNKVVLLTDNPELEKIGLDFPDNVELAYRENRGYDFGKFYQYFDSVELKNLMKIAIINDSNLLLTRLNNVFEWEKSITADFWGLIDSNEKPWFSKHLNNYHIQSHFLVLGEKAIQKLPDFFNQINIDEIFLEIEQKKVRRAVIDKWEIGLSQYFLNSGLKSDSYCKTNELFQVKKPEKLNATFTHYFDLVKHGYPLLKIKVIKEKKKWFQKKDTRWKELINKYSEKQWAESLIKEAESW